MDEDTKAKLVAAAETFQRIGVAFGVTITLWLFVIWATAQLVTAIW